MLAVSKRPQKAKEWLCIS